MSTEKKRKLNFSEDECKAMSEGVVEFADTLFGKLTPF